MDEEPLTLLHGWGMNSRVFEPLQALLEPRRSLFSPGLPGYSDSPWQGNSRFELQLEQMARDIPSGQLLGWSLGGIYAIELVLRNPQKFSALTLIACNPCFVRQTDWECAVEASIFETFSEALAHDRQRGLKRFLALQMQGEVEARVLSRRLWQQIVSVGEPEIEVLRCGLEILKTRDLRRALGRLALPVKLILGERDQLVPISLRQQISDVAPMIQVESVAGAGHAPFLSHPAEVAALM